MAAVAATYQGRVNVVGVASRGTTEEMREFVEEYGVGGFTHVADEANEVWPRFGVSTQPAFALIDDDGTVELVVGALGESGLAAAAEELLAS